MTKSHFLSGLLIILLSGDAIAATQTMTANISFDAAMTLKKDVDISFGVVRATQSGTYVLNTSGTVAAQNGGAVVGGVSTSGQITISGSTTQTVAISTGSYTAHNGVSLSAATCSYNGSAASACDKGLNSQAAPGNGKVLKIGVTATVNGSNAVSTSASPTFVVTVVYG